MIGSFDFATAGRIIFGPNRVKELPKLAREFGTRVFLVTGGDQGRHRNVIQALETAGLELGHCAITGEPSVADVESGAGSARNHRATVVIGIGGGSVIDAAKAIAALATNEGPALDYLEVVGRALPLPQRALPIIAAPTTAGTGSEATRNAVLCVPEKRVKVSLRHISMLPSVALVDPELTLSLPPDVTAQTGLDALTQLIEPYLSCKATPMTDTLCWAGILKVQLALKPSFDDGSDLAARAEMSMASLWGGIALANSGLGVIHALAGPLGGMFPAPHGAICAALLSHGLETNLIAARLPSAAKSPSAGKFVQRMESLASAMTGGQAKSPDSAIEAIRKLIQSLNIPPLSSWGVTESDIPEIAKKALETSSMKGNPFPLTAADVEGLLRRSLHST